MRTLFTRFLVLSSLVSLPNSCYAQNLFCEIIKLNCKNLSPSELVERNNLFYPKNSDTPFTGKISQTSEGWIYGKLDGFIKNGLKEGYWQQFHPNGQLRYKGHYIEGVRQGLWESYWDNGQLEMKGNFEKGKREGFWSYFNQDKTINHIFTGTYKNDARIND